MKAEREPALIKSFPSARLCISLFSLLASFLQCLQFTSCMRETRVAVEKKTHKIVTSEFHLWTWRSITQPLRCRVDPGLSNTRLPTLLISFLSFRRSSVVASIPKNKPKSLNSVPTVTNVLAQTPSFLLVGVLDISLTFADICDYA